MCFQNLESLLPLLLPGYRVPMPPAMPDVEYLGIFAKLLSPAYPREPTPPPIPDPVPYLYEGIAP